MATLRVHEVLLEAEASTLRVHGISLESVEVAEPAGTLRVHAVRLESEPWEGANALRVHGVKLESLGQAITISASPSIGSLEYMILEAEYHGGGNVAEWEWDTDNVDIDGEIIDFDNTGKAIWRAPVRLTGTTSTIQARVRTVEDLPGLSPWGSVMIDVAAQVWWTVNSEGGVEASFIGRGPVQPELEGGVIPPAGTPSPGMFFDASPIQVPKAFAKKSYPHWWSYTIRSWANSATEASDWYSVNMNNPDSGSFATAKQYGGDSRVRPMFRPPIIGTTTQWNLADRRFDIDTAIDYGHDGFLFDIINTWKGRGVELGNALRAARAANPTRYNNFTIIPMIDANSPSAYSTPQIGGDFILQFQDITEYVNGVMLWAVWHPASATRATLQAISDYITSQGVPNKMVGTWNSSYSDGTQGPPAYPNTLLYGEGPWGAGTADPANIAASSGTINGYATAAHNRGRIFVHPVRAAEVRPGPEKGPWWDESVGTRALAAQMNQVIANPNADWIQPVTWSDWTEDTAFAPGTHYGYARVLLLAYYLYRWKTGAFPQILRDGIILSHRQHLIGASVSYAGQTTTLPQRTNSPRTTPQNIVEALVWLPSPGEVRIIDAAGTHTYTAPAGMSVFTTPLVNGVAPKVEIWRAGVKVTEVQSTRRVDAVPYRTDWTYWQFTNFHPTTYQTRIPGPNPPYA